MKYIALFITLIWLSMPLFEFDTNCFWAAWCMLFFPMNYPLYLIQRFNLNTDYICKIIYGK